MDISLDDSNITPLLVKGRTLRWFYDLAESDHIYYVNLISGGIRVDDIEMLLKTDGIASKNASSIFKFFRRLKYKPVRSGNICKFTHYALDVSMGLSWNQEQKIMKIGRDNIGNVIKAKQKLVNKKLIKVREVTNGKSHKSNKRKRSELNTSPDVGILDIDNMITLKEEISKFKKAKRIHDIEKMALEIERKNFDIERVNFRNYSSTVLFDMNVTYSQLNLLYKTMLDKIFTPITDIPVIVSQIPSSVTLSPVSIHCNKE